MINILYIGDVVGQPGRKALHQKLNHVVDREKIDFTIVNIENAAGGFGVTEAIMHELSDLPINAYTSGNHIWDKKDFVDNYDHYEHVIRPANYPQANPGKGRVIRQTAAGVNVAVVQVMGNVFMPPCDNPFYVMERELKEIGDAHAHTRADRRRAHLAAWHRVPDGRRHDRRVRFRDWIPSRRSALPLPHEHAEEAGGRQARHPDVGSDDRSGRSDRACGEHRADP
jgi:hypothetical protein